MLWPVHYYLVVPLQHLLHRWDCIMAVITTLGHNNAIRTPETPALYQAYQTREAQRRSTCLITMAVKLLGQR